MCVCVCVLKEGRLADFQVLGVIPMVGGNPQGWGVIPRGLGGNP